MDNWIISTHHRSIHFAALDRDLLNWDHRMHQGHKVRSIDAAAEVAEKEGVLGAFHYRASHEVGVNSSFQLLGCIGQWAIAQ